MIARRRVEGKVVYNDGVFAAVDTCGVEGIEEGLFLESIQIHIEDTTDTSAEFRQRFPVGTRLNLSTTTEITPLVAGSPGDCFSDHRTGRKERNGSANSRKGPRQTRFMSGSSGGQPNGPGTQAAPRVGRRGAKGRFGADLPGRRFPWRP
jgi:hypothetical protein